MSKKLKFITSTLSFEGELNDSFCSEEIYKNLPLESTVNIWGDEIYFSTGITVTQGAPTMNLNVGDIAYWPTGKCLCIFFGPTPVSSSGKPMPASDVFLIGRTACQPKLLRKIKDRELIKVDPI